MGILVSLDGIEYLTFESLARMMVRGLIADTSIDQNSDEQGGELWHVTFSGGWKQTYRRARYAG